MNQPNTPVLASSRKTGVINDAEAPGAAVFFRLRVSRATSWNRCAQVPLVGTGIGITPTWLPNFVAVVW